MSSVRFYKIIEKYFVIGLLLLVFNSCSKDDEPVIPDETLLVDYEKLSSVSKEQLQLAAIFGGFQNFADLIETGVDIYKVIYKTQYQDDEIEASGLIAIPDEINGALPIVSAQHGTIFSNAEAPSEFSITNGVTGFEFFSSAGFVTLIPDFIGYGSSKDILHPYYNYQYTSSSVIDMIKAGKVFMAKENIQFNEQLFLTGYSEGGYATVATHKAIEEDPSLGLSPTAAAAGAGGYDIIGVMDEILKSDTYGSPGYLVFVVYAYLISYEPQTPLTNYFQEPYASKIPQLFNGESSQSAVEQELTEDISELFNTDFLAAIKNGTETNLTSALEENSVNDWKPVSPLRLYHSPKDNVVPFINSQETFDKMADNGSGSVEFFETGGDSHGAAALPMLELVVPWFLSLKK